MHIAVGGIEHESSSFIPQPTPLQAFDNFSRSGDDLRSLGKANDIIDGLVRGVREAGMEIIPLYWAFANSGGLCSRETYEILKERLLTPLRTALPVDGVLLSLHGAFSAQGVDDADGDILIAVHDLHSNVSNTMVQSADCPHCGKDIPTYGHGRARQRGRTAHGALPEG